MKPRNCIICDVKKQGEKPFCKKCYEEAGIFKKLKAFRESVYFNNVGMFIGKNRRKKYYSSTLSRFNTPEGQEDE